MLRGMYYGPIGTVEVSGQEPEAKKIRIVAESLKEPARSQYLRAKLLETEILAHHGYPAKAARAEIIRQMLAGRKEGEWKPTL